MLFSQIACEPTSEVPVHNLSAEFNLDESASILEVGVNTISGSAFFRRSNGGIVTCAGLEVELIPATAYAIERVVYIYGSTSAASKGANVRFVPDHQEYHLHRRVAHCNVDGYFSFEEIPDGEYFVLSNIRWEFYTRSEGGSLIEKVTVNDGETLNLVLTP